MTEQVTDLRTLPHRGYAGIFDRYIPAPADTHGVHASSDAIGGYYGIGWTEVYRDFESGELYRVRCSDGVYGGKGSYKDADEEYLERLYHHIVARTKAEAGADRILLSPREWSVMLNRTHAYWLDLKDGQRFADGDRSKDEGVIGSIKGIPVVVDATCSDNLPSR
ncbi:hypothetical protein KKF59_03105 [Patescibacteria group bacterium]|nr:hypothetical protein [Patescibacteria group bacterium]MBU1908094.1 hypothetical protein [Patescibacteria group bacterium]